MIDELDRRMPRVKDENMKVLEERYGILLRHVEQMKKYNRRFRWITMLRPINRDVAGKLKSGARGKIISIKGKSSEFIILAGDIPCEAGLSKLGKDNSESGLGKIDHFNSINEKSLKNSESNEKYKNFREKIKNYEQEIRKLKQQIDETKEKLGILDEVSSHGATLSWLAKKDLKKTQSELAEREKELGEKQQILERSIQEYNLNFNLNKIQKTVEIDGKTYECFYKTAEDGRPEYEVSDKLGRQPVVYVREAGSGGEYLKIDYNDSERGYAISSTEKKEPGDKNIKPIEIFSYEQYEKCAIDGENKIRIDNTTEDEFEIGEYYKTKDEPERFFVKAKKEGDGEFRYYPLAKVGVLNGQNGITTYKIDSESTANIDVDVEKLETSYEFVKPPLTADYDQLSAAEIYEDEKQIDNLKDLDSIVEYLKKEQEKLISYPADKFLKECKEAAKRLAEKNFSSREEDVKLIGEFLGEKSDISNDDVLSHECDILQLKFGLLGVCGQSVTKNTVKLGNILDYGISHGLEALHFSPEPIKLKHVEGEADEEFLAIDGEGNPRIARNLEGILFFINDQRKKGVCCLEPNPLWPVKINFNKTPHSIEIDENSSSPLLINGFYGGVVELQKKLETNPFVDKFIYAERLLLNSNFVPKNIKLPEGIKIEDVREEMEAHNLAEAYKYYGDVLEDLENLKSKVNEKYDKNFMKFCHEQKLSSLETNDVVLSLFRKKEVKDYFTNKKNMENLIKFAGEINEKNTDKKTREEIKKKIKSRILASVDKNIRDDVAEVLFDRGIRNMLLQQSDGDHSLKTKFFDLLPNIDLLKGFETEKAEKIEKENLKTGKLGEMLEKEGKSKNFLDCLNDYSKLVINRQKQIMNTLEIMAKKSEKLSKNIEAKRNELILNEKESDNYWKRTRLVEKNSERILDRSAADSFPAL